MGKDAIEMKGVVKECFPSTYRVVCDNGHELIAYLAGKMRRYFIRVMPGDHVLVEISPYDLSKGRIVKRLQASAQGTPSESDGTSKG